MMKIIILLCLCLVQLIHAGEFIDYPTPGRHNKLYVPTVNGTKPLPLFVMLPGCTQTPTECADGIKMNIYGERFGFFVLYAQQPLIDNGMLCWNWFLSFDQERGKGEPEAIANMVLSLYGKYQIDSSKIFVGGASAGAAMAVIMGVTYPDIFSAVLCAAGVEYKAASDSVFAGWVGVKGGPNAVTQGNLIYKTMGPYARPQKVMVVQGLDDPIVWKINSEQVITSFATSLDLTFGQGTQHGYITNVPTTTTPGQVPNGHAYTVYTYADSQSGETYITYVTVNGEGHAWSGGSKNGTFTDPRGPDISLMMVNFFLGLNNSTFGN